MGGGHDAEPSRDAPLDVFHRRATLLAQDDGYEQIKITARHYYLTVRAIVP